MVVRKLRGRGKQSADPEVISFERAYYIKLGTGGAWAEDSIRNGLLRLGWKSIPLSDILAGKWNRISERLAKKQPNQGTVTADTKRLRNLATSTSDDIWITFHRSRMLWCRVANSPIEEDATSKFRRLSSGWSDCDSAGRVLLANQIPGRLSQMQGFRGTVCAVGELDALRRLLNAQTSHAFNNLRHRRSELASAIVTAIQELHWKDFETLVDLVFREAGWQRTSVLGETMKYADLELVEPVTRYKYQVQIKSRADVADLREYAAEFSSRGFRKLYFVVHSPTPALRTAVNTDNLELVLPERLAEMVLDHGLLGWLVDRIR